jgi:hypothetical protein
MNKEAVVTYFKVSQKQRGGYGKSHGISLGRESNRVRSEYEVGALLTYP